MRLDAADRTVPGGRRRERVGDALERVGLTAAARKRYRAYSLGMRQRLGLAAALLRPRELLVLDEPTNGLDPQGTREVRHLVREVAGRGRDRLRLLPPAQRDRADVHPRRRDEPRPAGLPGLADRAGRRGGDPGARADLAAGRGGRGARRLGPGRADGASDGQVVAELGDVDSAKVTAALVGAGVPVRQLVVERPDLEELFVGLTGEGFDVDE